jgi:hypothetical protein
MRAILERPQSRPRLKALIVVMLLLLITLPVLAQSGGAYNLEWNTSDGGGGTFSTGGDWSLGGTIGQADAGSLAGGVFTLNGGFWAGGGLLKAFFLPLIVK